MHVYCSLSEEVPHQEGGFGLGKGGYIVHTLSKERQPVDLHWERERRAFPLKKIIARIMHIFRYTWTCVY
jgi:hypothetical protein